VFGKRRIKTPKLAICILCAKSKESEITGKLLVMEATREKIYTKVLNSFSPLWGSKIDSNLEWINDTLSVH
jgi:hypothetical protein